VQVKSAKTGKNELKETNDWQNNHGKLEEDSMEADLLAAKRKMKFASVENMKIKLISCQHE
jgi:hypothetical protein